MTNAVKGEERDPGFISSSIRVVRFLFRQHVSLGGQGIFRGIITGKSPFRFLGEIVIQRKQIA